MMVAAIDKTTLLLCVLSLQQLLDKWKLKQAFYTAVAKTVLIFLF